MSSLYLECASGISGEILRRYRTDKSDNGKQDKDKDMRLHISHIALVDALIDHGGNYERDSKLKACFKELKHRA